MAQEFDKLITARDIVLDTSVFTNPELSRSFGLGATAALSAFLALAQQTSRHVHFYMPLSVFDELRTFLDKSAVPPDFDLVIRLRSPRRYNLQISGIFLYELIDDIRDRINRGLRVAEQAVRDVESTSVEQSIARLRERYRETLRAGFLDSQEDLDVILLAYEIGGTVAASDEGLMKWADKLGVEVLHPQRLRGMLDHLIEHHLPTE
ncbi:MAG: RNA ligase partner protein [Nitrospirae bacterium]|nr:MAG: RNA ligase partner protein [Nitrospirota bacterium]